MRSFCVIQRAPNLVTSVLRRQTLTERPCDHGGRDWRGVTTAPGRLAPQKPEEPPEGAWPCDTWISEGGSKTVNQLPLL